jgi:hypothetical protein
MKTARDTQTLPLFGYDVLPTGEAGTWTVKARKPEAGFMRPVIRVRRAAHLAGCSVQVIYVAILAGELEADPVTPTAKRVFADSLYKWIEARRGEDYWTPTRRAAWQSADRQFNSRKTKSLKHKKTSKVKP